MTLHKHEAADIRDEGRWEKFMGKVRATIGDVTDDEMEQFKGRYQEATGYLKEKYGEAADTLADWWDNKKEG